MDGRAFDPFAIATRMAEALDFPCMIEDEPFPDLIASWWPEGSTGPAREPGDRYPIQTGSPDRLVYGHISRSSNTALVAVVHWALAVNLLWNGSLQAFPYEPIIHAGFPEGPRGAGMGALIWDYHQDVRGFFTQADAAVDGLLGAALAANGYGEFATRLFPGGRAWIR